MLQHQYTSLYVFVTNMCNLACKYCYEKNRTGHMSKETMKQTIDWLVSQRNKFHQATPCEHLVFSFFGGEPFMNWPVMKFGIEYIQKKAHELNKRLGFYILTNGTICTEEILEFLREIKKDKMLHSHMQISLDGCQDSHDKNRVFAQSDKGSFEIIMKNIKKYKEIFKDLIIRQTIVPENVATLSKDFQLLLDVAGGSANLTPVVEGNWSTEVIDVFERELKKCFEVYLNSSKKISFNYIHGMLDRKADLVFGSYRGCRAARAMLGISTEGDIYPCHRFVAYRSHFDFKIGDIWKGVNFDADAYKKVMTMHTKNDKCNTCKVVSCNKCYATNMYLEREPSACPSTGYCEMNERVTGLITENLRRLIMEKKIPIKKGEMANLNKNVAFNVGDGTEVAHDLQDVMARCLVKLTHEFKELNKRLSMGHQHKKEE